LEQTKLRSLQSKKPAVNPSNLTPFSTIDEFNLTMTKALNWGKVTDGGKVIPGALVAKSERNFRGKATAGFGAALGNGYKIRLLFRNY